MSSLRESPIPWVPLANFFLRWVGSMNIRLLIAARTLGGRCPVTLLCFSPSPVFRPHPPLCVRAEQKMLRHVLLGQQTCSARAVVAIATATTRTSPNHHPILDLNDEAPRLVN